MDKSRTSRNQAIENSEYKTNKNANLRYSNKVGFCKTFDTCSQRSEQLSTIGSQGQKGVTKSVNIIKTKENSNSAVTKNKKSVPDFDVKIITDHNSHLQQCVGHNVRTKNKNATLRYSIKSEKQKKELNPLCLINKACPADTVNRDPNNSTVPKDKAGDILNVFQNYVNTKSWLSHFDSTPQYDKDHHKIGQKDETESKEVHTKENGIHYISRKGVENGFIRKENKNSCLRHSKERVKYNEKQDSTSGECNTSCMRYDIEKKQHDKHSTSNVDRQNEKDKGLASSKYAQVIDYQDSKGLNGTTGTKAWNKSFKVDLPVKNVNLPQGRGKEEPDKIYTEVDPEKNISRKPQEKRNETNVFYDNMIIPEKKVTCRQDKKYINGHNKNSVTKDPVKGEPSMKRQLVRTSYLVRVVVVSPFTVEYLRKSLKEVESNLSRETFYNDDSRKDIKFRLLHKNPLYPV